MAVPGRPGWFYGVTDRGPNADDDGPLGEKVFLDPTFNPRIGLFQLIGGKAVLQRTIPLKAPDGTAYNGLANPMTKTAASAEKTEDIYGNQIDPTQPYAVPGTDPAVTLAPRNGVADAAAVGAVARRRRRAASKDSSSRLRLAAAAM